MGASLEFTKTISTEIIVGENTETVRVNLYVAAKPAPATRLKSSKERRDT